MELEPTVPPNSQRLIEMQRLLADDPSFLDLVSVLASFSPDERRAFTFIAGRHVVGKARYGALNVETDPRDFVHESVEEGSDLISYLAFEWVRRVLKRRAA